jgi:hypothetical protein
MLETGLNMGHAKMKKHYAGFITIAALALLVFSSPESEGAAGSVQLLIPTIDYPATGLTGTRASSVNNKGDLDFELDTASGSKVGYKAHGAKPISPLSAPGSTGLTIPDQLNDADTIVGAFFDGTTYHGFFLNGTTFTQYDVSGSTQTTVFGINDQGNFGGYYIPSSGTAHLQAYIDLNGIQSDVTPTGSVGDEILGMNNVNGSVGNYSTTDPFLSATTCGCHGFVRFPSGNIVVFDPSGSIATTPKGINKLNIVVGRYYDSGLVLHGFVYVMKTGQTIQYDHPAGTQTSLNGINDKNIIAGRYMDANNVMHGFLARFVP